MCKTITHDQAGDRFLFYWGLFKSFFKNITLHANDLSKTLSQVAFWKLFEYSFILALRERNKDLPHWISKTRKMETLSWPTRWSRRGETSLSRAFRSLPQRNHPVSNLPWPAVSVCLLFDWFSFDHIISPLILLHVLPFQTTRSFEYLTPFKIPPAISFTQCPYPFLLFLFPKINPPPKKKREKFNKTRKWKEKENTFFAFTSIYLWKDHLL